MAKVKPLENFFCRGVKKPYFEHSVRTSNYLFAMFEVMCTSNMFKSTFKEYTKDTVVLSGFLHDIGKLAVPEVLLLKNGDLTNHEWCTVRKHSLYGGNILSNPETCRQIFSAWPAAQINYIADTATYHHERVDGKGYPFGLSTYIPPLAKLCSIADTFDAITSNRPYRKGITAKEALAIMFSVAGTQLDRNIVRTLLEKPTWLIPNRICEAYIQKGGGLFGGNKKDSCIRDSEGFMQSKKRRVSYNAAHR